MNKKIKATLFVSGVIATGIIIIPIAVIAATTNQQGLNKSSNDVDENVNNLNKLSMNANPGLTQSASDVAQVFSSNKNNFSSLSNYFDTSQIESIATTNNTNATYLLETKYVNNDSTSLVFNIVVSSTINGVLASKVAYVTINNFPNFTQAAQNVNLSILNKMDSNLSALKLNTITPTLNPTQVFDALSKISNSQSLILSDFNKYFDTNSIATIINNVSNNTPLKIGYFINSINSENLSNGSISIDLACLAGSGTTEATKTITLNIYGFLSNNQIEVNNYVNSINVATNISGKDTILPSSLNSTNIAQYLNNMPALPNGLTQSFSLSNINDVNGTIFLNITVSGTNATSTTTNVIIVNGFETNNQILVNQYIVSLNKVTNISGKNTILPSTIVNTTANLYLNNVLEPPQGIELTYTISNSNNATGTADIIIGASASNANVVNSRTFLVSGFLTSKEINTNNLATLVKAIDANKYVANSASAAIAPQTIANTLDQITNLSLNDLNTYFDTSTIANALTSALGSTINSIIVNPIISADTTNGTISFNILFSIGQGTATASQSVTITVSGFLSAAQSVTQETNSVTLNNFINQISALSFKANTTSSNNTAQEIYTALNTQGTLNLTILNKYFDTSALTSALNASPGIQITNIIPMMVSSTAATSGIVSIYLKFSLGSGVTETTSMDIITITGFAPITSTTTS